MKIAFVKKLLTVFIPCLCLQFISGCGSKADEGPTAGVSKGDIIHPDVPKGTAPAAGAPKPHPKAMGGSAKTDNGL